MQTIFFCSTVFNLITNLFDSWYKFGFSLCLKRKKMHANYITWVSRGSCSFESFNPLGACLNRSSFGGISPSDSIKPSHDLIVSEGRSLPLVGIQRGFAGKPFSTGGKYVIKSTVHLRKLIRSKNTFEIYL